MSAFEKFIAGKAFIYVAAAYFLLMWVSKLELIGFAGGLLFLCYVLVTQKDVTPVLPVAAMFVTGISLSELPVNFVEDARFQNGAPLMYGFVFCGFFVALFIGCVIFHLIKYKHEKSEDTVPLFKPFIAAIAAMVLGGLFSREKYFPASHLVSFYYIGLLAFYVLCRHINPRGGRKEYFATLAVAYALVLSAEMFVFYWRQDNVLDALIYKTLFLGWGFTNILAPILVVAVPMALYLYVKSQRLPYLAAAFIIYAAVFFTVCRGEIFLLVLSTPFLALITAIYSKKKLQTLIAALSFLALAAIGCFIFRDFFAEFIDRISYFSDSGRTPLRVEFSKYFAQNPIFGIGYLVAKNGQTMLTMPHMITIKILSASGIVGFFAFIFFFFYLFKPVFTYKSRYNLFLSFSLIMIFGYAFADPVFYEIPLFFSVYALLQPSRRDTSRPRYKIWDKLGGWVDKSEINTWLAFTAGMLTAMLLFTVVAFTGHEKFLFGKEIFSYISTAGLFIASCVILPYSAPKIFTLIKKVLPRKAEQNK